MVHWKGEGVESSERRCLYRAANKRRGRAGAEKIKIRQLTTLEGPSESEKLRFMPYLYFQLDTSGVTEPRPVQKKRTHHKPIPR